MIDLHAWRIQSSVVWWGGVLSFLLACAGLGAWLGMRITEASTGTSVVALGAAVPAQLAIASSQASMPATPGEMRATAFSSPERSSLRWPLWEHALNGGIQARMEALTPPPWRFIGAVMMDGAWRLIVLRQGAAEPEFYKKGDRLPGGYTIRDIGQEEVTLVAGRRETVFSYIGSP
jgi:hypothetical protein